MDSQILWKVIVGTLATSVIADLIASLVKKSPRFFLASYSRLGKEFLLIYRVLRDKDFSQWKPQTARYVALRAIKAQKANEESPQPVIDLLEIFLKSSKPVVLLGEPGAGKTTALQALTYRLARRALFYNCLIWLALFIVGAVLYLTAPPVSIIVIEGISIAAPVYSIGWLASFILWEPLACRYTVSLFIEARSHYPGGDVNEWCEKIFNNRLGAKPLIGSRRRVAFLIDGVNEVEASRFSVFVDGWRGRLREKRVCRVVFTSRGGEENPAKSLGVENVLSVCDLYDDGVREFLKVYGREKAAEEDEFYNVEQAKRDFDELQKKNLLGEGSIGRNPYWLKMIVESGLYTINRGALFRNFAEKLIGREEDKFRKRERGLGWKAVSLDLEMEALAALALSMHEEKRVGFSDKAGWAKAWETLEERLRYSPYQPQDVLGEAQASTLLRMQLKERVEFVHQLVQEFFAAYALQPESKWQEALAHCEDAWWWQTLFQMGGLVGEKSAQSYSELVRKVLDDGSNEQRIFAAIGLLRSVDSAPSGISSDVIEAFSGVMEKNLSLHEGAATLNLTEAEQLAFRELTRTLGEEAVEAFAPLLEDSRIEIKIIGILILAIVGTRRAAELIIKKINDSIYGFVGITPLVQIGASAVEPLIAALRDEDMFVRRRVAYALGQIAPARAVEPLIAAFRDQDKGVRWCAEYALVRIGVPCVEPLIAAFRNKISPLRDKPKDINYLSTPPTDLCWLAEAEDFLAKIDARSRAGDALERIGAPSVGPFIVALRDGEQDVRDRAAYALGRIGDAQAIKPLIAALRDVDRDVRGSAGRALIKIGAPSVEPLIPALQVKNRYARESAACALGEIGDARAVEPLIAALQDKDEYVRLSAGRALIKIGSPSVEPLIAGLQVKDMYARERAAYALGEIGDTRALDELEHIAQVDKEWVAVAARHATEEIRQRQRTQTEMKE